MMKGKARNTPVSGLETEPHKQVLSDRRDMPEWMSEPPHPFRLWACTISSIFLMETLVMLALSLLPSLPSPWQAIADATLLSVLMVPFLFSLFRPMTRTPAGRQGVPLAVKEFSRAEEKNPGSFPPYQKEVKPAPKKGSTQPLRLLAITVSSVFLAEMVVMVMLAVFPPLDLAWRAIVDASLLSAFMVPLLFFSLFRPMSVHHSLRKKALGELRKFTAAVEQSPVMVLFIDTDHKIEYVNVKFTEVTGYAPEDVIGTDPCLLDADDNLEKYHRLGEALSQGREWRGEFHNRKKNGELYWTSASYSSVKDAEGGVTHFLAIQEDITGRRRAEEKIEREREFTHVLIGSSLDGIFAFDRQGRISVWNPEMERLFGISKAEALGKQPFEVLPSLTIARGEDLLARILAGEKIVAESRAQAVAGMERFFEGRYTPMVTKQGVIIGGLGILRDTSEKKRVEQEQARLHAAIEKSALEWRLTFDAVESLILVLDLQGRIIRINRATTQILGSNYERIVGRRIEDVGPGEPWVTAARLVGYVQESGCLSSCQVRDDASGRSWNVSASLCVAPGLDQRLIIVASDMTRLVELQGSLRRNEVMSAMGSLVAGVAHGVRNPLFAISATLDAFEARFGDRGDFHKYSVVFRRELDRLSKLMHDLLQYGRPGSESVSTGWLGEILDQAVSSCSVHAERMNVRIDRNVEKNLAPTMVHGSRLLLVFENILQNAIAHTPAGGWVKVAAKQIRENGRTYIQCVVEDTGPGFPEDVLARVFEPFFTRRTGGTGLGLSIARRIVEEHNGTIEARNHPQGGAAIEVRLPIQSE